MAMAMNIGPAFPKIVPKASPTKADFTFSLIILPDSKSTSPLVSTTNAVNVHTMIVSAKTSKIPHIPWRTGSFTFDEE